jgi:hypothetical protein
MKVLKLERGNTKSRSVALEEAMNLSIDRLRGIYVTTHAQCLG